MSQKETITTLFQLQEKYNCIVSSYFDPLSQSFFISAVLNSVPRYNVCRKITRAELEDLNHNNMVFFEGLLCDAIAAEFDKVMQNVDVDTSKCLQEPVKEDSVVSLIDWKRRAHYGDE